jgi:hypothetical protein
VRLQPQKGSAQAPLNPFFPLFLSLDTRIPFDQYGKVVNVSQMVIVRVVDGGAKG